MLSKASSPRSIVQQGFKPHGLNLVLEQAAIVRGLYQDSAVLLLRLSKVKNQELCRKTGILNPNALSPKP